VLTCPATSGLAGRGGAWRGEVRQWVRAHDVRVNGPPSLDFLLRFIFVMNSCLIRFDRDIPSRLRDTVTLGLSSLKICAAATELVTTNNHEPPTDLSFCLLYYYAAKAYFIPFIDVH
jgi:hypothetical protein